MPGLPVGDGGKGDRGKAGHQVNFYHASVDNDEHHDIQGRHGELHEKGLQEDSQQVKNGRKKTGTLFLISCLGVPLCMYGGSSVFSWLQFYKLEFIL